MTLATLGFRFALAVIFLLAGTAKVFRPGEFRRALTSYRLLPERLVRPVSRALPLAEAAIGVLLLLGLGVRLASSALATLLAVFAGAVAVNLLRGRQIDCGCLGIAAERTISWLTVVRNLALVAMAVATAVEAPRALALDSLVLGGSAHAPASDATAVAVTAVTAVLALAVLQEAITIRQLLRREPSGVRA